MHSLVGAGLSSLLRPAPVDKRCWAPGDCDCFSPASDIHNLNHNSGFFLDPSHFHVLARIMIKIIKEGGGPLVDDG